MNFIDSVSILAPDLSKWTRDERMCAIVESIRGIDCDPLEARDLIGVVLVSLHDRFKDRASDVVHASRDLIAALEELQYELSQGEPMDEIDAYKLKRAREAGL